MTRTMIFLAALLVATPALADDPAKAASAAGGVRSEMLTWIKDAEDKLLQLAEATPEEKFAYRPEKDVRSTAEVFMHVATANYGVPAAWGVKPPAGFTMEHEKSATRKADVIKALSESFAHMKKGFAGVADADLDKQVELFGGYLKTTVRGGYMLLLAHAHEHLGQSIAYARVNGIAPPWTVKQQEAFEKMQKKKAGAPK